MLFRIFLKHQQNKEEVEQVGHRLDIVIDYTLLVCIIMLLKRQ